MPEAHGDRSALREGRIDLDIGNISSLTPETEVIELSQRYAAAAHVAVMPRDEETSAVDDALAQNGLKRLLTVPSSYAALVVAARSRFVATVSERIVRAMAPTIGLVAFELPLALPPERQSIAWHPRHSADPSHRKLRALVQRVLTRPLGPIATR